ncbi:MAG TPA: nicotinate-nucleotide adenylyltransferase [Burkholderiaceae bacterium]|nr:nicotinate-nucleotide adenylyltransferase [Burkholderiaceae bacterium]
MTAPPGASTARRRVGFVGGTFDPPHVGHLALARAARDALALDELRLVPTGRSWQKAEAGASAEQRLEMARLAIAALPAAERLSVDDREVRREGPTYTVETLAGLRAELGPEPAIVLVLGSDQLRNLSTWHRWRELFDHAHVAATQRERVALDGLVPELEAELARRGRDALPDAPAGSIVLFRMPAVPVSATALRAQLGRGERPDGLSPPAVLDYIETHRLYRRAPRI